MPKTTKSGQPKQSELPSTLRRSPKKAQETFTKAYDAAADQYHDEERAHRVAFAAVKHTHEKVGDHWEAKEHSGPSDPQAEGGADTSRETAGGSTPTPRSRTCLTWHGASTSAAARR